MKPAIVLIIVLIIVATILIVTNRSKPAGDCYQSLNGPTFYEKVKVFWSHFQSKEKEFRGIIDKDGTNKVIEMMGIVMGGASGINHSYIDLIIFKGNQSIEKIYQLLEQRNLSLMPTVRLFKNVCIIKLEDRK